MIGGSGANLLPITVPSKREDRLRQKSYQRNIGAYDCANRLPPYHSKVVDVVLDQRASYTFSFEIRGCIHRYNKRQQNQGLASELRPPLPINMPRSPKDKGDDREDGTWRASGSGNASLIITVSKQKT